MRQIFTAKPSSQLCVAAKSSFFVLIHRNLGYLVSCISMAKGLKKFALDVTRYQQPLFPAFATGRSLLPFKPLVKS